VGAYRWRFTVTFIDDIIVFSRSIQDHLKHASLVPEALENIVFIVDEKNCHFTNDSVELLRHWISRLRRSTLKEKVAVILAVSFPKTMKKP
jgi:hypothetical protein